VATHAPQKEKVSVVASPFRDFRQVFIGAALAIVPWREWAILPC
jgi:hypothetical protein